MTLWIYADVEFGPQWGQKLAELEPSTMADETPQKKDSKRYILIV